MAWRKEARGTRRGGRGEGDEGRDMAKSMDSGNSMNTTLSRVLNGGAMEGAMNRIEIGD